MLQLTRAARVSSIVRHLEEFRAYTKKESLAVSPSSRDRAGRWIPDACRKQHWMGEQPRVALVFTSWRFGLRSRLRGVSGRCRSNSRVCSAPPLEGALYHDGP